MGGKGQAAVEGRMPSAKVICRLRPTARNAFFVSSYELLNI